ncbi:MAG: DUF721 domain-containing protein [Candidatus Magasanikbacteria bacterium]
MSSITPLGDALDETISEDSTLQKQVDASKVVEIAKEVIVEKYGEEQAKHAHPKYLKNGTLTISCTSSTMAQEIKLNKKEIVEDINQRLGKEKVDSIRYLT